MKYIKAFFVAWFKASVALDVYVISYLALPLAVFARDRLNINKWSLAREMLNAGMLVLNGMSILESSYLGFKWWMPFVLLLNVVFWVQQNRSIAKLRALNSDRSWVNAVWDDMFLRMYLTGAMVGIMLGECYHGHFLSSEHVFMGNLATYVSMFTILLALAVKAVPMPPPPPPREDKSLVPVRLGAS